MQKYHETTELWDTITSDLSSLNWSPRATSQLTFLACSWCHATSSSSDASSTRTLLLLFLNIISAVYQKRSITKPMRCKWRLFVRGSRLNQNNNPTVNAPCLTRTLTPFLRSVSPADDRLRLSSVLLGCNTWTAAPPIMDQIATDQLVVMVTGAGRCPPPTLLPGQDVFWTRVKLCVLSFSLV